MYISHLKSISISTLLESIYTEDEMSVYKFGRSKEFIQIPLILMLPYFSEKSWVTSTIERTWGKDKSGEKMLLCCCNCGLYLKKNPKQQL